MDIFINELKKRAGIITEETGSSTDKDAEKIKSDPKSILSMENPPDHLITMAVELDPPLIKYIKNPPDKAKMAAVESYPELIEYIGTPTEKMLDYISEFYPRILLRLKNPSEDLQVAIVSHGNGYWGLEGFKNPSFRVLVAAVQNNSQAIRFIDKRYHKKELVWAAVEAHPKSIFYLKSRPSYELQKMALTKDQSLLDTKYFPLTKFRWYPDLIKYAYSLDRNNPPRKQDVVFN